MVTARAVRATIVALALALLSGCAGYGLQSPIVKKTPAPTHAEIEAKAQADAKDAEIKRLAQAVANERQARVAAEAASKTSVSPPASSPAPKQLRRVPGSCRPIIDLACGNVTPRPGKEVDDLQSTFGEPNGARFAPYYVNKSQLSLDAFIAEVQGGNRDKVLVTAEQYHAQLATMGIPVSPGGKAELVNYLRSDRVTTVACTPELLKGVKMGRYDPKTKKFNFLWSRDKCLPNSQLVMDCDIEEVKPKQVDPPKPAATPAPVVGLCGGSNERKIVLHVWDPKNFSDDQTKQFAAAQEAAKARTAQGNEFSRTMGKTLRDSGQSRATFNGVVKVYFVSVDKALTNDGLGASYKEMTVTNGMGSVMIPLDVAKAQVIRIEFPDDGISSPLKSAWMGKRDLLLFPTHEGKQWAASACGMNVHGAVALK